MVNGEAEYKLASATHPVMDIVLDSGAPKRKRDVSEDIPEVKIEGANPPKRPRIDAEILANAPANLAEEKVTAKVTVAGVELARETIDSQFSLEILLKHEELRLINQELAKCQVALEQLRRCHLIPYPTSQGTPESMLNISNGTGPALKQGNHVPQWAAPYGVTDGPYTKHYAKWLIPDPNFDEHFESAPVSRVNKTLIEGRSTRNSVAEASTPLSGTKGRGSRGSTGQKLQALSSGYPGAKATGPSFVKRKDGQLVKLVCINCNREDFSSTQGFINHVRIAHKIEYKSHEEAAIACGQPVESSEMSVVSEVHTPAPANGLVHPLIRTTPTEREAYVSLLSHIHHSMSLFKEGKLPGVTSIPASVPASPFKTISRKPKIEASPHPDFVASTATPNLSAFMKNRGFGGNLTNMVVEAKQSPDFDEISLADDDLEDSEKSTPSPQFQAGGFDGSNSPLPVPVMRVPARATPFIDTTAAANHNKPSMLLCDHHHPDVDIDMMGPSLTDLSPNTVASNNAPSLVSDDGYDEGDYAESQVSEDEGSDIAEIDIEDCEVEKVVPLVSGKGGKDSKHVTFVSPVKGN